MSAALATSPLRRPTSPVAPRPTPHLETAPSIEVAPTRAARRARPKVAYAAVVVGGLGALMAAQLLVSIALSDGAYTIDRLQIEQKAQARTVQQLSEDLGRLNSPQNLAENAEALGMVANANPVWLRMSDGSVVGTPAAASAGAGLLGAAGSQVANDLLTGVPLVGSAAGSADTASAAPSAGAAQVSSQGPLPAPATR